MKFKVRLVAQGFLQVYEVDYQETFTSTVCRESLRMYLTLMTLYDLKLHQMDIKAAYLSGELDCKGENIYMHVSKSVTVRDPNKMACQIVKELYRLKQSARL